MRTIAVPVANRPECAVALDVAFALGATLGSDVIGYHIRPNRRESKELDLHSLVDTAGAWPAESEAQISKAAISAKELFSEMAQGYSMELAAKLGTPAAPKAVFREKLGSADKLFPFIGPVSDLMVVSRPKKGGGKKASIIMMSALMNTSSPVLILPQKRVRIDFERIAIAWNNGQTESLLVHGLLPLLKAAKDVVLITEGSNHQFGASASDMTQYLKAHGVKARRKQVTATNTADTLVKTAKEEKAGMLVCGAYTRRSLTSQRLFGGVTQHLLSGSDFPVIMMHV